MSSRRRSAVVTVGAVALVAASLSGCSTGPDYRAVCVDRTTSKRVADRDCDSTGSGGGGAGRGWYYVRSGSRAPAVGGDATGGSFDLPSGASAARGGVSAKGGTISRGGFGGGHGSFGG